MENKINIAELLKDCPTGMELDCTMFEDCKFLDVDTESDRYLIRITTPCGIKYLDKYGCYIISDKAKCVIFPKGKTTWEGFMPPCKFKDGDIVSTMNGIWIGIVKKSVNCAYETYITINGASLMYDNPIFCFERFATEEEKQELFDAIKANGYKWNAETKTLEKLIEPKFKVWDKIRHKDDKTVIHTINYIYYDSYGLCDNHLLFFKEQDQYELVPNKFDISTLVPFESRVLVRDTDTDAWKGAFYSHYKSKKFYTIGSSYYYQCIPYEENKHLLDTNDDCDEYYKNW